MIIKKNGAFSFQYLIKATVVKYQRISYYKDDLFGRKYGDHMSVCNVARLNDDIYKTAAAPK